MIEKRMKRSRNSVQEIHIAVLGMDGSGKSALTVKYLTKRFITEYDPNIEDTYCKHETVRGQENMVWIMDTVDSRHKDQHRFLGWADVFLVVYGITSLQSFERAKKILRDISGHDHSFCDRHHLTYLLGNKTDLDRYRQVSKAQGSRLATEFSAEFFELNTTEEYSLVKSVFHHAISAAVLQKQRLLISHRLTPPRTGYVSDSESSAGTSPGSNFGAKPSVSLSNAATPSPKNSFSALRRSKSPAAKVHSAILPPLPRSATQPINNIHSSDRSPPKKSSPGLKLFKIFQNERQ